MILTGELAEAKTEIQGYAEEFGLDFFFVIFEVLHYSQVNEIAAKGGFPVRYPHWRFGMEYEELSKGYTYGLQKIYEMVINNDPCYAYLQQSNNIVDQKLVMAHVYAHCDFFKNNYFFSKTNRKMMDEMANHATQIKKYIDQLGIDVVEDFIDRCLTLENLIDYNAPFINRKGENFGADFHEVLTVRKIKSKKYMDKYINPPEYMEAKLELLQKEAEQKQNFPEQPERDILAFLLEYAPLAPWQHDILAIIQEEAYYFAPQGQTKIMNEGWASYWHSRIMTSKVLQDSEVIDYADHHSGTVFMGPGRLNPYKIGIELFRDIEERWNKGKFGKEYDECDDFLEKKNWDKNLGLGRKKIFEVRKLYNDITFIDTFLTQEFCQDNNLFTYRYNEQNKRYEINSREFSKIKQQMLFSLTNMGQPIITVVNANYENKGELLLEHQTEDVGLDMEKAQQTLENVQYIWTRPVYIKTLNGDDEVLLSFNGEEHKMIKL